MDAYFQSPSGRLMGLAFGLMLAAGAAWGLASPPDALWFAALLSFGAVVSGVLSITLGFGDFPVHALLQILFLPFIGYCYVVGMGALLLKLPQFGYVLAALSAVGFGIALRPARFERETPVPAQTPAPQH